MKRLTIRNGNGSVSQPVDLKWAEALERLAAYEDTGLSPEDVAMLTTSPYLAYGKCDSETVEKTLDKMAECAPGQIMLVKDMGDVSVWIPTAEQLPPVGEPVLIVRHSYNGEPVRVEPAFLRPDGRWNAMGHKFTQKNVSHWMPMPVPPQEGEI